MTIVLVMQLCSSLSCISSLFIILTFFLSPDLHKSELAKLVSLICTSDLFGSIGMAIGHPENGSFECWLQAILTNIFPISGVFWTTLIAYMLLSNVFKLQSFERFPSYIYLLCCFIPIIFTFLPLITNQFGVNDHEKSGWCFLRNRSDSPSWSLIFWTAVSFYIWMWGGMLAYLILFVIVIIEAYRIYMVNPSLPSWNSLSNLLKYLIFPFNLFICWFPSTVYDFLQLSTSSFDGKHLLHHLSDISPTVLGFLNAIAFISTNDQMRQTIYRSLLFSLSSLSLWNVSRQYDDDDGPIRVVYEEEQREREREKEFEEESRESEMIEKRKYGNDRQKEKSRNGTDPSDV